MEQQFRSACSNWLNRIAKVGSEKKLLLVKFYGPVYV